MELGGVVVGAAVVRATLFVAVCVLGEVGVWGVVSLRLCVQRCLLPSVPEVDGFACPCSVGCRFCQCVCRSVAWIFHGPLFVCVRVFERDPDWRRFAVPLCLRMSHFLDGFVEMPCSNV